MPATYPWKGIYSTFYPIITGRFITADPAAQYSSPDEGHKLYNQDDGQGDVYGSWHGKLKLKPK